MSPAAPAEGGTGLAASPCEDWAGVVHDRAPPDARIACLVPSVTELLFALGLGAAVVARTGFCVHPRDAVRRVRKIGGTKDFDLAALAALAPTHLVVNVDENRREAVDAARAFVPHVIVTHPTVLADNLRLYRLIGAIFGRAGAAETLCAAFVAARARLASATAAGPRECVLYLIWKDPWMTVGGDTYIADALRAAAWDVPAVDGARYPVLGEDASAWQEAERILVSTEPYAFRPRDVAAIAARRARPVHLIDGEMTSWYGPRAIAGMDYLATFRATLPR